jgi:hypothetical protein
MANPPSKDRGPRQSPPGISLEKTVARIQQMLDPQSTVTHNERLVDRVGNSRQYDVVIRGAFAGRNILGIIECKDHSRRKGPDAVEAFAKKCENLGANLRLMVSRCGFTPQALSLAKHEGIGCLSLLPDNPDSVGFSIGDYWYGVTRLWLNLRIGIDPLPHPEFLKNVDPHDILADGKPVVKWFLRELLTKYQGKTEERDYTLTVTFSEPRVLTCAGQSVEVNQVFCIARRQYTRKRRWVTWSGDALYDWHKGQFTLPDKGILRGSVIETDLDSWPDYDGLLPDETDGPKPVNFITATLVKQQKWPDTENSLVPDLTDDA